MAGRFSRAVAVRNQTSVSAPFFSSPPSSGISSSPQSYVQYARAAYSGNEIVYSVIELLATSAAEPHIIGRRWRRESPRIKAIANGLDPDIRWPRNLLNRLPQPTNAEAGAIVRNEAQLLRSKGLNRAQVNALLVRNGFIAPIPDHPAVKLLNAPNPYMSRGQLWSTVVMDEKIAGNAYVLMAPYTSGPFEGSVAELWRLRPDRVKIIPDPQQFCRYEYRTGEGVVTFDYKDVMHFKTRNPFNEYYGMSPIAVIMDRLGIDMNMRGFLRTFYERGGTGPGAILTVKQKLAQAAKDMIADRLQGNFGGPQGWHRTLVLDAAESTYQQLGLNRGLRDALPAEIDKQTEARLTMPFGVPGSIVGLLIGYESSSYANKRQDWQVLWDVTMTPLLSDLDDVMNLVFVPRFGGIDEVMFDLSDIKALQEDVDAMWTRYGKALDQGAITIERFCDLIGEPMPADGHYLIPNHKLIVRADELDKAAEIVTPGIPKAAPAQIPAPMEPKQLPAPANIIAEAGCADCGRYVGSNVNADALLYCLRCKAKKPVVDKDLALA